MVATVMVVSGAVRHMGRLGGPEAGKVEGALLSAPKVRKAATAEKAAMVTATQARARTVAVAVARLSAWVVEEED